MNLSRCYRGSVDGKRESRWIENLSRIYRADHMHKKLARWKENLSRICRETVKLEEKEFFKGGKTHKDKCNKQATQPKIQSTY